MAWVPWGRVRGVGGCYHFCRSEKKNQSNCQYLRDILNLFYSLLLYSLNVSEVNMEKHYILYSGPWDLRPLYLTIPCILRPDLSDTTGIFSV